MPVRLRAALAAACLLLLTPAAQAELKLPSIFGEAMVLQRDTPIPVWGWAEPNQSVTVMFREQSVDTQANAQGEFHVELQPEQVGKAATLSVQTSPDEVVKLENVLVGEVWIASGQSNMVWPVAASIDADLEAQSARYPGIRLFQVPQVTAEEPQDDVEAQWQICGPETVSGFSAVGYYFARTLHKTLNVPVGIIQTAWGGTRAEAWTPKEFLEQEEILRPIISTWDERTAQYDAEQEQASYEREIARWQQQVKQARAAGKEVPRRPQRIGYPPENQHHYSALYNAMVAPLVPYANRGVIWYQGESNASRAHQYRTLMPTLIKSWRSAWDQGDFPFYMVQLANFREVKDEPTESDWAELREAQTMTTEALPHVGQAVIVDIGAALDIHPKNKQDVGKRLARLALYDVYGYEDRLVRSGPTVASVEFEDGKAIARFENIGGGLITYYREPLRGFAIAGEDRKWRWAECEIRGNDTVVCSHPDVQNPVALRYNWADNPQGTLYNAEMLPAAPFRTDDWPGVTDESLTP